MLVISLVTPQGFTEPTTSPVPVSSLPPGSREWPWAGEADWIKGAFWDGLNSIRVRNSYFLGTRNCQSK